MKYVVLLSSVPDCSDPLYNTDYTVCMCVHVFLATHAGNGGKSEFASCFERSASLWSDALPSAK